MSVLSSTPNPKNSRNLRCNHPAQLATVPVVNPKESLKFLALSLGLLLGGYSALAQRPLGIDVSITQGGNLNWNGIKNSGVSFAWAKATQGSNLVDATFGINMTNAIAAGVPIGAYHFARPDLDLGLTGADVEAAWFWNNASNYIRGAGTFMMPVIDIEQTPGNSYTKASLSAWVDRWCQDIIAYAASNCVTVMPIVRTTTAYSPTRFDTTTLTNYPLAMTSKNGLDPQTGAPSTNAPWTDWTFWQYATVEVNGDITNANADVFNGTTNGLAAYVIGGVGRSTDLGVSVTADNLSPNIGDTVNYTLLVTNKGPITATGIVLTDILPTNWVVTGLSQTRGTFSNANTVVVFNVSLLGAHQTLTATIAATAASAGAAINTATVAANENDYYPCDNFTSTNSLTIIPPPPIITNVVATAQDVSAFVSWKSLSNGTTQVYYDVTTNLGNATTLDQTLTTNHVAFLSGLQASTLYYFRVSSFVGGTEYTANGTFTTSNSVNVIPMFTNVVATPQNTSAFVSWMSRSNGTTQVAYGTSLNFGSVTYLDQTPTTSHLAWITGLQTNTLYYFRASSIVAGTLYTSTGSFSTGNPAAIVIVDNPAASFSGLWTLSTAGTDKYGTSFQTANSSTNGATSIATFTPLLPSTGLYDVYIWYSHGANWSTNATFQINGNSTQAVYHVNESIGGGQWLLLTTAFPFAAGTNGNVTISNDTGETNTTVIADAVEWIANTSLDNPPPGNVPDSWARAYFGAPVNGSDDADGDGYSNYQEYVLGTNPNNSSSALKYAIKSLPNNILQFTFSPYQGGRNYHLQQSVSLVNPAWLTLTNQPVVNTNGEGIFTITTPGGTNGYYRLVTQIAP